MKKIAYLYHAFGKRLEPINYHPPLFFDCLLKFRVVGIVFIFYFFIMNIFVAKLDYGVTSEDLREVFEEYGDVSSCNVIFDKMTRKSKGFAFVEMPDDSAAQKAIAELNEASINGRAIVVKEAESRPANRR